MGPSSVGQVIGEVGAPGKPKFMQHGHSEIFDADLFREEGEPLLRDCHTVISK